MNGRARLARLAAAALLFALLGILAVSESRAAADRRLAERAPGGVVDADVEPAAAALAEALSATERSCADLAALALERTGGVSDRARIFEILASLRLPDRAGLHLEDRHGATVAWAGETLDDGTLLRIARSSEGTQFLETGAVRRVAVRRSRTSPVDGVPVLAVCHLPIEVEYPLRNRFLRSWSLADDAARRFAVGSAQVLAPGADGASPVPGATGGEIARIAVTPLPSEAWVRRVDEESAVRRARIVAALAALLLLWGWAEASRLAERTRALARAALVAAARLAAAQAPVSAVLTASPLTDQGPYVHPLPLALAASPLDLLLTCLAALGAASLLRRAAIARPLGVRGPVPSLAALAGAALLLRAALDAHLDDVTYNSTVTFFPDDAVLPHPASAALLAAVFASGGAAVLLLDAVRRFFAPSGGMPARAAFLTAAGAAALAAPLGPSRGEGDLGLTLLAVAGFAAALVPSFMNAGVAVRAALIPLGIALGTFAPLERYLDAERREQVVREAAARVASTGVSEQSIVASAMRRIAADPELADAARSGRRPSRDLLLRLWSESPLAGRRGGSSIDVRVRAEPPADARFAVNLPPRTWLPDIAKRLEEGTSPPLAGRGPGEDGRWIVGVTRLRDGGPQDERVTADVRVTLEVRPPSVVALPELEVFGPPRTADTEELPPLSVSTYSASGALLETNDPARPAGSPLLPEMRDAADAPATGAVRRVDVAGRSLAVVVRREGTGDEAVYHAFSFDTGGARRILLRCARAALCGAAAAALLLLLFAPRWVTGVRFRLAHRLIAGFVIVSGASLLVLGWANRELARARSDEAAIRELREALALMSSRLPPAARDPGDDRLLSRAQDARDEFLHDIAYEVGRHASVFRDDRLVAASDPGLFDTELLPRRLPADVYREVVLRRRPFHASTAVVGDLVFDVGYAPIFDADREVVGALSVPLLMQRRTRDRELADGVTAILGLYLASLAAAVAVGTWIAGRLTAPLRDLTDATGRVSRGDLSRPVPNAGGGELGEVVRAFNAMMSDLAASRERLVRAEREAAWRDMARQVAHDVKNPLTPMRLAAEMIRRAFRDRHPKFEEMLEKNVDVIVRQTESLKSIATGFSDFARLSGTRRAPTDLAEIVRGVFDLWRATPALTLAERFADGVPPVLCDPDEMRRVVVNVVKNAVEALDGKPGSVTASLSCEGGFVTLRIEDDGPGIPDDVRPRLFEPYFSTKTSGTGLGLAICKRVVEDFGGTITLDAAAPRGTVATIRLPVAPAAGP